MDFNKVEVEAIEEQVQSFLFIITKMGILIENRS